MFGKNHGFDVTDIFDVERQLVDALGCMKAKTNSPDYHNVIKTADAMKNYKFNWSAFSAAIGFKTTPPFFITTGLDYVLCATELLLENWTSDKWRTYWIYIFIRQEQRYNRRGHTTFFEYEGKFVRGQSHEVSRDLSPIYGLGFVYNAFLANKYIHHFKNDQNIKYVETMGDDLKAVFRRIISRNTWLESSTKKTAINKLDNMKIIVGSICPTAPDPNLKYSSTDGWLNLLKFSAWKHGKTVALEGTTLYGVEDVSTIDWSLTPPRFVGTQVYVVNASYTASENKIYIPLGFVQKPFVDLTDRGIEYNLARIGVTLAHEMSHALDDWGSEYDANGKLNNWWTDKDRAAYKKIQLDITRQYETFAKYDGIKFDASHSIGENIADISGLTICREYLRDFQIDHDTILPIQKISFEAFFIYYAFQQRQILSDNALDAQLKTNPHPIDKYRTNVPLSRLPIFRTLYNIKRGDKMWWHSTSRIWED